MQDIYRRPIEGYEGVQSSTIAHLGIGSFSEEAATAQQAMAGFENTQLITISSIPELLTGVQRRNTEYSIVPIENTTTKAGHVAEAARGLVEASRSDRPLQIVGEQIVRVEMSMYQQPGAETTIVASKDKAIEQCRGLLSTQLANHEVVHTDSTAAAVEWAGKDPRIVAIASPLAADQLGITNLGRIDNVQDNKFNITRFVVVRDFDPDRIPEATGNDRTTVVVDVPDKAGSLVRYLDIVTASKINLSEIKSVQRNDGVASLLLSFDGHVHDQRVRDAVANLWFHNNNTKFLGSYPKADYPSASESEVPSHTDVIEQIREKTLEEQGEHPHDTIAIFTLPDTIGSLRNALDVVRGINLASIDSFPTGRRVGEYAFRLSFANHVSNRQEILELLRARTLDLAVINNE